MEQFSLDKYLENPSRKVVTRDEREVRIICTNCKSSALPIIAEIQNPKTNTWFIDFFNVDGTTEIDKQKQRDLFFADEEEELSEFEKDLQIIISEASHWTSDDGSISTYCQFGDKEIKKISGQLLDLARKELEANYYTKVLDDRMVLKSKLHATDLQTVYDMGKQDALKDLPKWKKAKKDEELDCHVAIQQDDRVVLSDFVQKDEYYITFNVLKTLPKEE